MRRHLVPRAVITAGVAATLFAVYLGRQQQPRITLASLQPGQDLHLVVRSQGCFHSVTRSFHYERQPDGRLVKVLSGGRWDPVSDQEIRRMDDELEYARTARVTDCTTVRYFDLRLSEGERRIATDSFSDQSCGAQNGALAAFARQP